MGKATAPPKKRSVFPLSAMIATVIAIPVGYWAFSNYRVWAQGKKTDSNFQAEMAALNASNAKLSNVYDAVQLKTYQVCNKSSDQITVEWVSAAYHDGRTVKVFDSDRCQEWKPLVLAAGDNKNVLLRSSQPGCNWDGRVMYYAMRYVQENEADEKYKIFTVVGPYQNFDRDCYPFQ